MSGKTKALKSLLCILSLISLTGCGQSEDNLSNSTALSKDQEFSYWLGTGENVSYYPTYADNPCLKYLTNTKKWGTNQANIKFSFRTPPSGTQTSDIVTMFGTDDLSDIIDFSFYKGQASMEDLYNNNTLLDLTEYVENKMPNYKKWLADHPDIAKYYIDRVGDTKRYMELYSFNDSVVPFWGYCYRRDWLVEYGTNPTTGKAFTGGWQNGKWSDDVVFPSKLTYPKYISDWEWMLDIFKKAVSAKAISDGYPMSLYYTGANPNGDLVSSFGGGGSFFYNDNGTIEVGTTSDNMRVYLTCMNKWYQKGYIDKTYAEHTSDMFYATDSKKIHAGKVGLWYGQSATLDNFLDISEGKEDSAENGYTKGICVFGARQPINDIYGGEENKYKDPNCFYSPSLEGAPIVISSKAKNKDLDALFSFLDYTFSDEGKLLNQYGLSKAQYEETQDSFYTEHKLTDGAYSYVDSLGNSYQEGVSDKKLVKLNPVLSSDTALWSASKMLRTFGRRFVDEGERKFSYTDIYNNALDEWLVFKNSGTLQTSFYGQLKSEDALKFSTFNSAASEFLSKSFPKFISGAVDIASDDNWNSFCTALKKRGLDNVKAALQETMDYLSA
ncbi:MAG: hypothetical protein LKJ88_02075 [Bacilli bacterium]|jgi:hypothetical protein|nr:hypothetical protein [Bacilli bacterium]